MKHGGVLTSHPSRSLPGHTEVGLHFRPGGFAVSGKGDVRGCQGLSNTCARWCDERNCDCFWSILMGCQKVSAAYALALIRNRCTITAISVSTPQVWRRVSHVSAP